MVFSSLEFLFLYLPITLLIYFLIPKKYLKIRNLVLFLFSLVFYGWSEPKYIVIMFYSIAVDYTCGHFAGKYRESNHKKAKTALVCSVVLNLACLGFFKYSDFIIGNINTLFKLHIPELGLALPVGISFYTFQTMSYTLDVYMGDARVQDNIISFGSYVTMFPQLIAGPIVRYRDVDDALRERSHTIEKYASGTRRFMIGLCKKVLLANTAGAIYETFRDANILLPSVLGAWLGIIFYSFQIYFDFSGYSDMAIGLGRIMGFEFPQNFNFPYISKSITEFWRRWHITLSTWFREYVYIPLGGNRKGKLRTYFNLFVVWFLTGLWHGASWNFVLWGLYFFVILVIEKAFLLKLLEKCHPIISHLYSLILIVFGWFIFTSCDISNPTMYLKSMFSGSLISGNVLYNFVRFIPILIILAICSTPLPIIIVRKVYERSWGKIITTIVMVILFFLCVAYLVESSYNPFLYFRF